MASSGFYSTNAPLGSLIHPAYTQYIQEQERLYSLLPLITEFRERGAMKGTPVVFQKVDNDFEFMPQSGDGNAVFQRMTFTEEEIDTKMDDIAFEIPSIESIDDDIDQVAWHLKNVARRIVANENERIVDALQGGTYSPANNNQYTPATGDLSFEALIEARKLLKQNHFGSVPNRMAVLASPDAVVDILNDDKLVNKDYITSMNEFFDMKTEAPPIGVIPAIGPFWELPDLSSTEAYLIDIDMAIKSLWDMKPIVKQLYSESLLERYRAYMKYGVELLNEKASIQIVLS